MINIILTDQPRTLMIDGKVAYGQFNSSGFEGIVSTVDCTIWYINFEERACIRVLSPHFQNINDMNIYNDVSMNQLMSTCASDQSIRVYNSEYEQIVAFRQSIQPLVVKFSKY